MKTPSLPIIAALIMLAAPGCDKQSPEISRKIAELQQKNNEAAERQRELEQQIEDQKLAAERDAIERERARIEEDRAELERQQGEAAAEQDESLRQREEAIATREGRLEQVQVALDEKEDQLGGREQELTERDRELAGREALDFEATEQNVPVGDYGTFYDSLSSYGSWFETSDYGYVWQPAVVREVGWRPYCRGRWVCSDRGWTWLSDEPFGWATYHYGRWALIHGRGWVWVPGSEWAPCWVSWRENDNCIGWAPLPPETMAYRGRRWDSTVDVQFGIGAICFNFVEIRHFGSPVFRHCLPISSNFGFYNQTTNVTYIHDRNNYVICGGPRYQRISDRIGKPLPFYRLEVDHHPRVGRDPLAMRPQVSGGRLRIAAPNMDAGWNADLRPKQIRGRIETVNVERGGVISSEITDRYRQSREEDRQRADKSIADLGGRERFEERRTEQLRDNRREVEGKLREADTREAVKNPERPKRDIVSNREGLNLPLPAGRNPLPEGMTRPSDPNPGNRPDVSRVEIERRPPPTQDAGENRSTGGQAAGPRVAPAEAGGRQEVTDNRRQANPRPGNDGQAEQAANTERDTANRRRQEQAQQRQAEQAREAQDEAMRRRQEEQARQKQEEKQRLDDQAREARKQAMEEQREQARQQQQAENEARRQQQEQQQREMQRQQEQAQQRQQEEARQRQQDEDRQRQQEQARQREQEQTRQQQQQKDDDDRKKRNR